MWKETEAALFATVDPALIARRVPVMGGFVGAILTGVFAVEAIGGEGKKGLIDGNAGQVLTQLWGALVCIAWCAIATFIILKIVDSLVNDIVMPVVGRIFGGLNFADYFVALAPIPANIPHTLEAVKKAGVPVFAWGNFVTIALNFLILAFVIFLMVKQVNRLKREAPAAPPAPPEEIVLLREIRDSLARK